MPIIESYHVFQPLIALSSSCVKAGDDIIIEAGIGSFSTESRPRITINGEIIRLNDYGVASYNLKTLNKSGKYSLPVKIEFTTPDGRKDFMTKNISYTVIE